MHIDFGTGDGVFAYRLARRDPQCFVLGLDADPAGLRRLSAKAAAKAGRGGLPNIAFGRLALEMSPGALAGFADTLSVILPWGSLLRAVAMPEAGGMEPLRALLRAEGRLELVFGYSAASDPGLSLPPLDAARLRELARFHGAAARFLRREELRELPSTWAGKLAFSGKARPFVRIG